MTWDGELTVDMTQGQAGDPMGYEFNDVCEVIYLERTPAISTTAIIEHIADL